MEMAALAGRRAGPARGNKALERAFSLLSTGSLNTGKSSTGTASLVRTGNAWIQKTGTVHFFKELFSSIGYCWAKHLGGGIGIRPIPKTEYPQT